MMVYKIKHDAVSDSISVFVSADYSRRVMEYLVAYIQNKFCLLAPDYYLSPGLLADILCDVYDCEVVRLRPRRCVTLDILDLEVRFSPGRKRVMAIRMFEREGLLAAFVRAAHAIEVSDGDKAVVTLRFDAGEHGSVSGGNVCWTGFQYGYSRVGANWGDVICKPDARPDPGCEVEGWYLEDGIRLEHDTKITCTQPVTVRFRKIDGVAS